MSLKSVSKNTVIYSLGTLALRFTTFLLIPLYTHYLTKAEFGLLQTLLFTIQIIITINDVGMRSALMRFFAEYEVKNKISELMGSSTTLNITIGLVFLLVATLIPDTLLSDLFDIDIIPNLLIFTVLVGVSQTLSLNILSYFRAKDQGIVYMVISLTTSIILIVTTYVFLVTFNFGIIGVLWAQSISFTAMWLIVLTWIIYKHGFRIKSKTLKLLYNFGFPLIFAMSGDLIINTSGNYLLGYFNNFEEVAIFSLAYKIAAISIMVLIGPFQMAYEPFIFREKDNEKVKKLISSIATYISLAYLIVSVGIVIIFKDLINVIGTSEYEEAYHLLFLLLPGIGATIFNYIGQSLLHFNNKTKVTGGIVLFSTVISMLLLYFLVKSYGTIGLIVSLNFYLLISSFLLLYFGIREVKINLEIKRLIIIALIGIGLFISIYYLSFFNSFVFYFVSLFLLFITLFIVYLSNFFIENEKKQFQKIIHNLIAKVA